MPYIFTNLRKYERASGAKLNKNKTTGLMIGCLKNKTPNFNDISWTKTNVKTLGIHHGYDIHIDELFTTKIAKIKACLNTWKSRNLTFQGKILIIQTLVISKILYDIEIIGIPQKIREYNRKPNKGLYLGQ